MLAELVGIGLAVKLAIIGGKGKILGFAGQIWIRLRRSERVIALLQRDSCTL